MNVKLSLAEGLNVADMLLVKLIANGHEGYFALSYWPNLNLICEDLVKDLDAIVWKLPNDTPEQVKNRKKSYSLSVTAGEVQIENVVCVGIDSETFSGMTRFMHPEIIGYLGLNFLRELNATIDFNKAELTLRFPDKCRKNATYVMVNQGML